MSSVEQIEIRSVLDAGEMTLTQLMSKPIDSRDSGSSVGSLASSGHGSSDCLSFIRVTVRILASGSSS